MKISDLKTFVVANPPPSFGGRYFIFVKLTTDDGIEGVGEIYSLPFDPHVVATMAGDVFQRFVEGSDPFAVESLFRQLYSAGFTQRPDISMAGILSAFEMACYDIMGKATGQPVHNLLGGRVHERLRSYTYLYPQADDPDDFYDQPELGAERAAQYAARGFTAVKFDPAGPYSAYGPRIASLESLDRSQRFCKLIREAVGPQVDLLFGTHGQFTPSGAIRLGRRLEAYDPLWFEEPVPPESPEGMAKVAQALKMPIATGERLTTKYEFARVLQTGAASILQMNLGRVGGLLEAKKIAGMAEAHGAVIAPHLYCGPIVGAANIQLAASCSNFLVLEGILDWGGFHAEILKTPIRWEEGHVIVPTEPGLGVELDEDVANAHPYDGKNLHLEMSPNIET